MEKPIPSDILAALEDLSVDLGVTSELVGLLAVDFDLVISGASESHETKH